MPAILSYLDDFKIDKEDIVATLLMIELKGKIKIQNEDIQFLNETVENLEENEKLEGLRKYLIDYFSKIEEKTKEELMLWEEYLVYSVLLGINTKVIEEVCNKIGL